MQKSERLQKKKADRKIDTIIWTGDEGKKLWTVLKCWFGMGNPP
jgi:hypothetical protein